MKNKITTLLAVTLIPMLVAGQVAIAEDAPRDEYSIGLVSASGPYDLDTRVNFLIDEQAKENPYHFASENTPRDEYSIDVIWATGPYDTGSRVNYWIGYADEEQVRLDKQLFPDSEH